MSACVAGHVAESCGAGCPHSVSRCCGGGGCGEPVSGDGSSAAAATATSAAPVQSSDTESRVAEAQAFREWDDTTPFDAELTQKMTGEGCFTNGAADITRECADSGERGEGRGCFCRQSDGTDKDNGINIDHKAAGLGCFMSATTRRNEGRAGARLPPVRSARARHRCTEHAETAYEKVIAAVRGGPGNPDPTVPKRRGCSYNRASKRVCFSDTYCGTSVGSNGEARVKGFPTETLRRTSLRRIQFENITGAQKMNYAARPPDETPKLPSFRTAKGRVRLYRVRSFLANSANHNNGAPHSNLPLQQSPQGQEGQHDPCVKKNLDADSSSQPESGSPNGTQLEPPKCASTDVDTDAVTTEGPSAEQLEVVRNEAERRQVELGGRTEHLWRRLQAVQAKQVERHVTQQLSGLHRSSGLSCTRRPSPVSRIPAELSRLARSCSEILRTAESALDSDHTASSSGGGSDTADFLFSAAGKEWEWAESRAWLGSRWVWLQSQVSELEYRIRALTELYAHLRQGKARSSHSVPDTPVTALNTSTTSQNCRLSSGVDPNRKLQTEDVITPQTAPSPPSSSARVRPFLKQRRHRLIRLEGHAALESKAVSLPCWCDPPTVCVLCGGSAPHGPVSKEEKALWMHRTWLDMSIHPVLSMPSATSCLGRRSQGRVGRVRKRIVCPRPPSALPPLCNTAGGFGFRSQRSVFFPNYLHPRAPDLPILPPTPTATDTPNQPLRRRRMESSYDIDNLVMPLGLTGLGARVQKLQYKEILTPSWRELDSLSGVLKNKECLYDLLNYKNTKHQPNGEGPDDESEVEDLSEVVFLSRHAVCESRERSRWGSWARRRRRGRSSSYQDDAKSFRGLEQTPGSPDSRQSNGAEGDVSPERTLCTAPEDLFCQLEDEQQAVLPWERRSFPLQDSELQWLQEEEEVEPDKDPCTTSGRSQSTDSGISVGSLELSPRTP
ncbi:hypothetical protein DNTS_005568 [Danionella cerebrum]|uniref:PEHE domain-containing protein n=1 Tax=Danionella cerebrum TaxID=2873325 RepID=A0A553NJW0_9TELE|nr:hypothetical protein DNTS_005568 [Danionella translucida]